MTTPEVPDLRALLRAPAQAPAPTAPAAAVPAMPTVPAEPAVPSAPVTEMPVSPTEVPGTAAPAPVPSSPEGALSALPATTAPGAFSPEQARKDVPILHRTVNGHPLVWLDNGATTQKPRQVIEALSAYYSAANSNIHRGAHTMAREATELYEAGRTAVAEFLGAESPQNIAFARGTTEAINLVAQSWGRSVMEPGDEILVPVLEHHSNIVPWQLLAEETHARVVPVPLTPEGEIDQKAYADLLSARTQLVVISQASNVLGTVPPVEEMTALAHRYGARVLVDGAQAVAHMPVDVQRLGADFYVFSGHKLFAPTGIGALYMKPEMTELMRPWQGGGNMIESVSFERTTFAPMPHLLEAGTGHISGVVGLLAAIDWLRSFDREAIAAYENALMTYAMQAMATVPGLEVIGSAAERIAVLTFTLAGHDPASVADWLDKDGIAVRAGHHCAQPALAHYGLESAARASFALYNTSEEVDQLVASLRRLRAGA
ncbi:cysteine desulfurase [Streptomyces spectabilis]|uniref:cysteine desulfurase n=1 Tax=Streptomyces spectabilis TaxID=68270 RepID=A0A516RGM5_STRST|nr:cysteine desulfurase [Streptomyces spectabilis]QDQ14805.1 SufS family cysteine desulfurase [Streptomyces spectabilis]